VFEGNLFSLEEYNGTVAPSAIEFAEVLFWVRMFQLTLSCMSKTEGVQLGSSVGQVVEVETDEDGVGWGEYLLVRVWVDLSKPLVWGRMLKLNGNSTWIVFQYEKLTKFCFQCGMVRHGVGGCLNLKMAGRKGNPPQVQFGSWLQADGYGCCPMAGGSFRPSSSGVADTQLGAISGNALGEWGRLNVGSRASGGAVELPFSGLAQHATVSM